MPVDLSGEWTLVESDGFEGYLRAMGTPENMIQLACSAKPTLVIQQTGDDQFTVISGPTKATQTYSTGTVFTGTVNGQETKNVASWEGDKLVIRTTTEAQPGNEHITTREIVDGKLIQKAPSNMADVKMYLTIFTLVLAFLFHVIGFATPNWSKDIYHGETTTWGLWEVCPPPKYEACTKRYLPPSSYMFWYTTITRILECVALFFYFIAPLIAGYLTYHANKGRNVTRGWRRTCTEPFGNASLVIIALAIYGIMQDAILDYSFFLTCVSALLSIIAGILSLSVKFPQRRTQYRAKNGVTIMQ